MLDNKTLEKAKMYSAVVVKCNNNGRGKIKFGEYLSMFECVGIPKDILYEVAKDLERKGYIDYVPEPPKDIQKSKYLDEGV